VTGSFRAALHGGSPRQLRNEAVIEAVIADPTRIEELFDCVCDDDEYVRMRASDALEKVCRSDPGALSALTERVLTEMAAIDQPSVQWHFAQIVAEMGLRDEHRRRAVEVLERNLDTTDDWIVINNTMEALARFAEDDPALRDHLVPRLDAFTHDRRKSVSGRARKLRQRLSASRGARPALPSHHDVVD
jgi:hypothetical protein